MSDNESSIRLKERLLTVLECSVCLEVNFPKKSLQCLNGHITCELCIIKILADATIVRKKATCPTCRVVITWENMIVCEVAMRVIALLPKNCLECAEVMTYREIENHMKNECPHRLCYCKYFEFGCVWTGSFIECVNHEVDCRFRFGIGISTIPFMRQVFDIKVRRYYKRSENRIIFTTDPFTAFDATLRLHGEMEHTNRDYITENFERKINFRLIFERENTEPLHIEFFLSTHIEDEMEFKYLIFRYTFKDKYTVFNRMLHMLTSYDVNRFLAKKITWLKLSVWNIAYDAIDLTIEKENTTEELEF